VVVNPYKRLRDVYEQEFARRGVIGAFFIGYAHNVSIIEQMIGATFVLCSSSVRPLFVGDPVGGA
jgi:hypothetical protein